MTAMTEDELREHAATAGANPEAPTYHPQLLREAGRLLAGLNGVLDAAGVSSVDLAEVVGDGPSLAVELAAASWRRVGRRPLTAPPANPGAKPPVGPSYGSTPVAAETKEQILFRLKQQHPDALVAGPEIVWSWRDEATGITWTERAGVGDFVCWGIDDIARASSPAPEDRR